jgi:hypothetical protein
MTDERFRTGSPEWLAAFAVVLLILFGLFVMVFA